MKNEKKDKKKFIFKKKKSPIASIYIFLYTDLLMLVVIYTDRGIIITDRGNLSTDRG